MSQQYPGGFITKSPPALNPAMGNAAPGVWTMDQVTQAIKNGTWPAYDPYFKNVTLLLHGNGTNGAQNNTFLDGSTNNFTITRNGNTTQGTFSPYGSNWSNYFDGSGDYLTLPDDAAFEFGSGNFTVETWIFATGGSGTYRTVVAKSDRDTSGAEGPFVLGLSNGNKALALFSTGGTGWDVTLTGTTDVALNTWHHIATTRDGNTFRLFLNGVLEATATSSISLSNNAQVLSIGINGYTAGTFVDPFTGYISNLRLLKGTAQYTATFTPPTAPLTAITNTSLLTCQSNRFIDNSSNAFTITRNGDTSVQRFSPFSPSSAYSASVIGGSGYFDGTGDYLTVANNTALQMGTGDFTIEFWWYPISITTPAYQTPFDKGYNLTGGLLLQTGNGDGKILVITNSATAITASTAVTVGSWNHMALVRNGTTLTLYLNGASVGSATNSVNLNSTSTVGIGANAIGGAGAGAYPINGYMSNVRVVKGTAVYTSAFTPPTSPVTAITNTSLLLNFTNAGIIDNAMMNDLETVGNAQISTTQSKFGGSSMYFDGSGDYLSCANNVSHQLTTGNWTIEGWIYPSQVASYMCVYCNGWPIQIYVASGTIEVYVGNNSGSYSVNAGKGPASSVSSNVWSHFAFVKNGDTYTVYVNGVAGTPVTTTTPASLSTSLTASIGTFHPGTPYAFNGYIYDLRITKGVARYTANFTPQTSQWQDQ